MKYIEREELKRLENWSQFPEALPVQLIFEEAMKYGEGTGVLYMRSKENI